MPYKDKKQRLLYEREYYRKNREKLLNRMREHYNKDKEGYRRIHTDDRGEIWGITVGEREYILILTKKGYSRGGDYHKTKQFFVVLEGQMLVKEYYLAGERTQVLMEGGSIIIPERIPHMFTAETDCLVLEWLEGEFEKEYFEPYRKIIRRGKDEKL